MLLNPHPYNQGLPRSRYCRRPYLCNGISFVFNLIFVQKSGYYESLTAGTFTTKTKDIIFFAYTALPGILALISIFPMFKYDIVGEKKAKISTELAARRK